jgi:hypothetical protein
MPNHPEVEVLLRLHGIDTQVDRLATQKDLLPVSLRRIEAHFEQQRQAAGEKRGRVKQLRTDHRAKELNLKALEGEAQKLTVQLNTAKTNKEYAAFQHEIAAKKADASRIEDELLTAMADVDELEAQARELDKTISQIEREYREEAKGVEKDTGELEKQIATLRRSREAAAAKVEPALLGEYERIASKRGSSALAAVTGDSCQGCFMQLPPEIVHKLRGARSILRCPSCSRLLYLA